MSNRIDIAAAPDADSSIRLVTPFRPQSVLRHALVSLLAEAEVPSR